MTASFSESPVDDAALAWFDALGHEALQGPRDTDAATQSAAGSAAAGPTYGAPHAARRRLLGLLGPTHGFTAPWPLLRAAFTEPNVRGADAFVLVTRGAMRVGGSRR